MSDAWLVGTWNTRLDDDGRAVPGLVTFSADGGVVSVQANTRSVGLGTWRSTGPDTFAYEFRILAVNDEGEHVGHAHVTVEGEFVSASGWHGTGGAEFHDPQGTRLRGHSGSKVTADRLGASE
ncbi:hypothetical protein ACIRBZ_17190 [Streptomyces sp. NPDC094038]|uniref:hypothetical protein n=1 Tax=Streptomyces sp. NPDC094038 TaxID=3366055 RepID=UPI00382164F7